MDSGVGGALSAGQASSMVLCPNCQKEVPAQNRDLHLGFCQRNNWRCATCGEVVRLSEREEHELLHKPMPCDACGEMVPLHELWEHKERSCSGRECNCRYCTLIVTAGELVAHEEYCGARTQLCELGCGKYIKLKDMDDHLVACPASGISPQRRAESEATEAELDMLRESAMYSIDPTPHVSSSARPELFTCPYGCKVGPFHALDDLEVHLLTDCTKGLGKPSPKKVPQREHAILAPSSHRRTQATATTAAATGYTALMRPAARPTVTASVMGGTFTGLPSSVAAAPAAIPMGVPGSRTDAPSAIRPSAGMRAGASTSIRRLASKPPGVPVTLAPKTRTTGAAPRPGASSSSGSTASASSSSLPPPTTVRSSKLTSQGRPAASSSRTSVLSSSPRRSQQPAPSGLVVQSTRLSPSSSAAVAATTTPRSSGRQSSNSTGPLS